MSGCHPVLVRTLDRQPYSRVFAAMQAYTVGRDEGADDELWVVEHDPVFTQGQAGKAEHVLAPGDIEVVQTDRGGQVTYHGPGQVVIYLLFDLRRLGIGVKALVRGIEQSMVRTLAHYQVVAAPRDGAPGVYVGRNKIGALGLRVKRGCSYHGLSLNVAMDLEPFSRINPCGLLDTGVTDLLRAGALDGASDHDGASDQLVAAVQGRLLEELAAEYDLELRGAEGVLPS
ncbi:MAG: lipoyl(octanoyl) transferase LipB [Pseudomonadota bacterium]